jgi:ACR3 family arsenite efflux pump ArsB
VLAVISQGILFEAKGIKYLKNKGGSYIRFKTFIIAVLLLIVLFASCAEKAYVPEGFIHINQVIPDVVYVTGILAIITSSEPGLMDIMHPWLF